jgi:hypothetical protein
MNQQRDGTEKADALLRVKPLREWCAEISSSPLMPTREKEIAAVTAADES